jgi:hypothetical protein
VLGALSRTLSVVIGDGQQACTASHEP